MLKSLILAIAGAALVMAAPAQAADTKAGKDTKGAKASKKKKKKASGAHHCVKDGKEVTTTEKSQKNKKMYGKAVRREKTCTKEGGTWELASKDATASDKK